MTTHRIQRSFVSAFGLTLAVLGLSLALPAKALDSVTVGTITTSATTVDVPVYIRDTSGTPLGVDQPAGSKIQGISIQVNYAPAAAVSSVTFSRAGITASLTPSFETSPSSAGSISLLDAFAEATNPVPFTLNAAAPGNQVAHLVFTLSASATPSSTITLTLDSTNTQLNNEGGTTTEKGANLQLVNGAINIPPLSLTLLPNPLAAQLHGSSTLTATISAAVTSPTSVALSSSNTAVATVPPTVTIQAGATSALIPINALSVGSTNITGTLPPATGGASTQATVNVVQPSITLTPFITTVPNGGSAPITATISAAQPSDTTLTLSSSDTTVATVPASVVLLAGHLTTTFNATGLKVGSATIQALLPQSLGGGSGSNNVQVSNVCLTPDPPVPSAPTESQSATPYDVTWPVVSSATEYLVDESTDAGFANPSTTTVSPAKATFSHVVTVDTRFYYRVRAHNKSGSCDNTSASSTAVSVLVKAYVAPPMRILAVVGSLPGAFGSFFKTSVQLYNPQQVSITGKIVFHPAGASGTPGDPTLTYALAPGKTITYDDLLPAMSTSGLGSADIVADTNSFLPVSSIRVFNDGGVKGTSGFGEEAMPISDALVTGDSAVLIAPADFTNFRLNIGLRTLDQGANLTITVRDRDGIVLRNLPSAHYDPTYFKQFSSSDLLGLVLTGGETITLTVNSGSIIIYGSTTDDTTQDPTLQVARKSG
jgi:Bacterial Ig-like domain (group 2)